MQLSDFLKMTREFVGDGPTDNLSRLESLDNPDEAGAGIGIVNNVNRVFVIENFPVISIDAIYVDHASVPDTQYTLDADSGTLVFVTPPATSAYISYYYYLMTDDAWIGFVNDALSRLNLGSGDPEADVPGVPQGLITALISYSCGSWARRIAMQSGLWYNQRLQERQEERDTISKKYMNMADGYFKDGDAARDNFYKGSGGQYTPAMQIVQHTPRAITPER